MLILGIETTCDETGVAIVEDGKKIISNFVSSSVFVHKKFGGVVPEVAAREQIKAIIPLLKKSYIGRNGHNIDAVAVSYGPGLIGSLLIGVETAKALSYIWKKPLIGVNHLIGHVYSCWLQENPKFQTQNSKFPEFPLVALVVSGGHTDLLLMKDNGKYHWLGGTRDDAAGEVFDKVARELGLSYPGGPEIERVARNRPRFQSKSKSQISNFKFTRPMIYKDNLDFSFSGLKTQVVNKIRNSKLPDDIICEIAFQFQEAVVDTLVSKTVKAAKQNSVRSIVVAGGVAANERLRDKMHEVGAVENLNIFFPEKENSIDNGAMIAAAAYFNFLPVDPLKLLADPALHF